MDSVRIRGMVLVVALGAGCTHHPSQPAPGSTGTAAASSARASSGVMGTYEGYVEATPEAPDSMKLTITSVAADGTAVGTLQFDRKPIVPMAPPPSELDQIGEQFRDYRYPLVASSLERDRLRFGVRLLEPYGPWCEKQVSYGHSCAPRRIRRVGDTCYGSDGPNTQEKAFDCELIEMCGVGGLCECNAEGCRVRSVIQPTFDMVFEGDGWTGSVEGFGEGPRTVRFRRVPM